MKQNYRYHPETSLFSITAQTTSRCFLKFFYPFIVTSNVVETSTKQVTHAIAATNSPSVSLNVNKTKYQTL